MVTAESAPAEAAEFAAVRRVVVIGAGHAGGELVAALRAGGFDGRLALIGAEPDPPYQRPPLSKKFLLGDTEVEDLWARPLQFYRQHDVELVLGTPVDGLDLTGRRVRMPGRDFCYDRAVLATGGRPRTLPDLPPNRSPNVHYVKTIGDVTRLRARLDAGTRLVVIGGGFLGLEVAASAGKSGARITVLESTQRVLGRVCSAGVSQHLARVHTSREVAIRTRVGGLRLDFDPDGRVSAVLLDSERIPVDELVVSVGMAPETDVAQRAGLRVEDGILVDTEYRTSDPAVFAIGDCARVMDGSSAGVRLESAPHAASSARRVAALLLGVEPPPPSPPWFWSNQYDTKIQLAGDPRVHPDRWVTRGSTSAGSFVNFGMVGNRVERVEAINRPADFTHAKTLISRQAELDPALLSDENQSVRQLASRP